MSLSRESIASQDPVREISWNQDLILMGADTGRDERIVLVHNIVQTNSFEAVNLSRNSYINEVHCNTDLFLVSRYTVSDKLMLSSTFQLNIYSKKLSIVREMYSMHNTHLENMHETSTYI